MTGELVDTDSILIEVKSDGFLKIRLDQIYLLRKYSKQVARFGVTTAEAAEALKVVLVGIEKESETRGIEPMAIINEHIDENIS